MPRGGRRQTSKTSLASFRQTPSITSSARKVAQSSVLGTNQTLKEKKVRRGGHQSIQSSRVTTLKRGEEEPNIKHHPAPRDLSKSTNKHSCYSIRSQNKHDIGHILQEKVKASKAFKEDSQEFKAIHLAVPDAGCGATYGGGRSESTTVETASTKFASILKKSNNT